MGRSRHSGAARHVGRLLAGFVLALFLAATPAMAQAAFRATAAGSFTTSTYVIAPPASIAGTYSCDTTRPYASTINITSFGKVPRATAYQLTLIAPDGTSLTQSATANANTVTMTKPSSLRNGTYTYELSALVGTWTGTPYRGTYTC
ncbi:hypothetical protein [Pseudarthrobacter equi]|uniref:hypothetical protein n=1 Tax=Pseudarthrobacter equi TaxID=728066 RepID=UPI0028D1449D|nr:hypothetical protein [Pseudarthrobacter equi]